jgi:F-type H+-transporting ATPase subunit b
VLIDWFTVCAQAINFLILVWLLQRFLYKPVLAAIDAREKTVAAKIAEAADQVTKARVAGEELHKRNEDFDHEREGLMRKATEEVAAQRQRLIESARQDSQLLRVKLTQSLAAERAELAHQLSVLTQAEVFALTRKALTELAGASVEDRMMEVLIEQLRKLPADQKPVPAGADRVVLVRSAHDPSPAGRANLEAALRECIEGNISVRFETASELVCGLELSVGGVKLAWSVSDYLSTLASDAAAIATTDLALDPSAPSEALPVEAAYVH